MARLRRFALFLGAICLASTGCEPHRSWLRQQDEDELPPKKTGLNGVQSDASKILGVSSDDQTTPTSFFKSDRRTGGWSSEAQEIERDLGAY